MARFGDLGQSWCVGTPGCSRCERFQGETAAGTVGTMVLLRKCSHREHLTGQRRWPQTTVCRCSTVLGCSRRERTLKTAMAFTGP